MIVNNYTNEIRENKASDLNFFIPYSPQLFIRQFPCRIKYNEKLVIPYFVSPYNIDLHVQEKADETNAFIGTYIDGLDYTYTTILQLDCDVEDPPANLCFKNSTFSGDGCFEIGPFDKNYVGEHTFSIESIQSDGVTSNRQYFKFLVEDPDESIGKVNLNTTSTFSGAYMGTVFIKYKMLDLGVNGTEYLPVKKEIINALYTVTVEKGQNRECERIRINVAKATSTGTTPKIRYTKITGLNDDGSPIYSSNDIKEIEIGGDYYLTTYYQDGQNKLKLVDYVDKQPRYCKEIKIGDKVGSTYQYEYYESPNYEGSEIEGALSQNYTIPDGVFDACVHNKEALLRLLEAAQAKTKVTKRSRLILPKNMDIVTTYETPTERYLNLHSGFQFEFPDYFTLDLNGSTIYTLPSLDLASSGVIGLDTTYDSHICNGHIYGNYKYIQYENQQITSVKSATDIGRVYPEWLGITSISDSKFSSFDNVEFAYATGYDAFIGAGNQITRYSYRSPKGEYCSKYLTTGYIDYNGEVKQIKHLNRSKRDESPIPEIAPEALKSLYVMRTNITSLDNIVGSRAAFPDMRNLVCGNTYILSKIDGASTGLRHKTNRSNFIHFYDKNKQFIKTVKVDDANVNIYPKNAKYAVLSAFGHLSYNHAELDLDCLTNKSSAAFGSPIVDVHGYSWGCGYDNCIFKDFRTSILDNQHSNQCYISNCYMWELATERYKSVFEQGYSNQQQFIDLEDGSVSNLNFLISNCEHIYGYGRYGGKVHISYNLLIDKSRNINYILNKGNFGGTVENSVLRGLTIGEGFSSKTRYETIKNCHIDELKHGYDSGAFVVADCDLEVYVKDSSISQITNEDNLGGNHRLFPTYLNNCNLLKNKS